MTLSGPVDPPHLRLRLVPSAYDSSEVQTLVAEVQQVYVERYGGRDETPVDPGEFTPPQGHFVLAHVDGEPAAMGGWRFRTDAMGAVLPGVRPAEIKRMYVREALRGQGLARAVLAELERTALAAGADWMVLETGNRQPEAIALYQSSGYTPIDAFGFHACTPDVVNLGRPLRERLA